MRKNYMVAKNGIEEFKEDKKMDKYLETARFGIFKPSSS